MRQREKIIVALRKQRSKFVDSFALQSDERRLVRQYLKMSAGDAQEKFKQWSIAKRDRIKLYYLDGKNRLRTDTETIMSKFREKSSNARARWRLSATGRWNRLLSNTRRRRDRIRGRFQSIAALYSRYSITINEPFRKSWFTLEGYPLVSKDPYTGRFVNPWNSESTNGFKRIDEVWKWKKTRMIGFPEVSPANASTVKSLFGFEKNKEAMKQDAHVPTIGKIKLNWIGHATNLIQFSDQFTVLTDPMFSNKASPFQWFQQTEFFGVPRWTPPSLRIDDLGKIDVVVISHDHYDHLDLGSVKELNEKEKVQFWAVPLGIKDWLITNIGIKEESIIELEWWQRVKFVKVTQGSNTLLRVENIQSIIHDSDRSYIEDSMESDNNELNVTCAPAQHWCSRSPFDRNTRLWCSWAIQAQLKKNEEMMDCIPLNFYFAGDTGYPENFPLHRQIGDLLGPFDLAAIPIGAYKPRFFMKDSHCDPKEAVKIHKDIRSNRSVAIHWGTFPLANEPFEEPPTVLRQEVKDDDNEFV
eukprot:CAMPEP_0176503520 /NCGR_PEP_ID=MMETSP0200_2-20121128/15408_1 /TAXON_ID=947934 /ORGANISM="Chaetoceros sp., Strain GSL56" /LENGTH=526 /DNA_ID=CAMNT_0017902819 /DNA_START=240 /DNA_END=1817 /DNA_ORIENTATION=-